MEYLNEGTRPHEIVDRELRKEDLHSDPIGQFGSWFQEAYDAGIVMPNAMSLATVSAAGEPSLRMVLLKLFDANGFVFFTNYHSRKASEITANENVALLFFWSQFHRQVKIRGWASRISTAESLRYFVTRPRGSQLGAWCSPQSQPISSRSFLDEKLAEMKSKFAKGDIPLPTFWGGFRVVPKTIEFWQGRKYRLHDRFQYERGTGDEWTIHRLAP